MILAHQTVHKSQRPARLSACSVRIPWADIARTSVTARATPPGLLWLEDMAIVAVAELLLQRANNATSTVTASNASTNPSLTTRQR